MALRKYKPTSPGRRFMTVSTFEEVTKDKPEKSLTAPVTRKGRPTAGHLYTKGSRRSKTRTKEESRLGLAGPERVLAFQLLVRRAMPCFIRKPRGRDIFAACGQLKRVSA